MMGNNILEQNQPPSMTPNLETDLFQNTLLMRRERAFWLLLIGLVLVVHFYSLKRFPEPFVDDAIMASRAWEFLKSGRPFGELDLEVFDRFEGYWTVWPYIPTAIQSIGFFISRTPSLIAIRAISLLSGVLLLINIFFLANYFGGKRLAFISVFLTTISTPFFVSAHLGRMDIFSAIAGFSAITIILYNLKPISLFAFIAGLISGIALEIHPYNLIFLFVIGGLFSYRYRKDLPRKPDFWAFAAGVILAGAFYILLHVIRYPSSFFSIMKLADAGVHSPPILTMDARTIIRGIIMAMISIAINNFIILPFLVMALVKIDFRQNPKFRLLAVINLLLLSAYSLIINQKIDYYAILISPPLTILAGAYILQLRDRKVSAKFEVPKKILLGSLLIASLLVTLRIVQTDRWAIYQNVQNRINRHVRTSDTVMGSQLYWFGLIDHTYYSWEEIVIYQRYNPKSDLEMAFLEFKPDIFVIDHQIDQFVSDDQGKTDYEKALRLPEKELNSILDEYGVLVDEFDGYIYGTVQVYRFNWEKGLENTTGSP